MRIALMGMAGSGKSFWSEKLEKAGFVRFCCDELIAERLSSEMKDAGYEEGNVAGWMGFPYDPGYKKREAHYMECEREVMEEIIGLISGTELHSDQDVVIDTTGSFIYIDDGLLQEVRKRVRLVLISTPDDVQESLLQAYINHPHPMVWRDFFQQRPGESHKEALARCYPKLFKSRRMLYEKYAHFSIDYYALRAQGFTVNDLIARIRRLEELWGSR